MRSRLYILDGHLEVPEPNILKWAAAMEGVHRIVKREWVENVEVSTVFLGINQNWGFPKSRPLLYETMTFSNRKDFDCERRLWHTWAEAEDGHAKVCRKVKALLARKK